MRLIVRLLVIVAAFLLLRSLLAPLVKALVHRIHPPARPPTQASAQPGAELRKDPVCGTFVAPELAVTHRIDGEVVYFCSQKCRDQYARTA